MSIDRLMDKEMWFIYTMEYYSVIKRNTFRSVLMRWINLEPIIQGEVNQKEKDKYRILMHIYGIQKDGTDKFIFRAAIEKQTQKTDLRTQGEGRREKVRCMERVTWKFIIPYVKQIANGYLLYDSRNSNSDSVTIQKGGMGMEMKGGFGRDRTCVYLWLILVDV